MATKSIRISEKIHSKLKIHVAKNKISIVDFADRAIIKEIEMDRLRAKNLKAMTLKEKRKIAPFL